MVADQGKYFGLNAIGLDVWRRIEVRTTVADRHRAPAPVAAGRDKAPGDRVPFDRAEGMAARRPGAGTA